MRRADTQELFPASRAVLTDPPDARAFWDTLKEWFWDPDSNEWGGDWSAFTFPSNITGFQGATFGTDIDFSHAVFRGRISFQDAVFKGAANFQDSRFENGATFDEVVFEGNCRFVNVESQDTLTFENATFEGVAHFMGLEVMQ